MPDPETQLAVQVAEVARDLRTAVNELTQTTTVLRQHIGEQQAINRRRERWEGSIETRVTEQEVRHAALVGSIPKRPVDAEDLHKDIGRVETRLAGVEKKVDGLSAQVWKWSGGVAAIVAGLGMFLKWLIGGVQ